MPCMCRKFADGFPNVFVKDATRIRNRHVAFLASFQDPASIFEQLSVIYQLPRMFVGSFTLVLPYFPTGTAERVWSLHRDCLLFSKMPKPLCCQLSLPSSAQSSLHVLAILCSQHIGFLRVKSNEELQCCRWRRRAMLLQR